MKSKINYKKFSYTIVVFVLSITTLFVSILIINLVKEKFFFDKLIYYKDMSYGYFIPNKDNQLSDFGSRAEDLIHLNEDVYKEKNNQIKQFNIALIGDSYLWGMGNRYKNTVSARAKKHFKNNKEINITSVSYPGNSLLDYLEIYRELENKYGKIDFYIFFLVDNDLLPSRSKKDYSDEGQEIIDQCEKDNKQKIISTAPFWEKDFKLASSLTQEATTISWTMSSHLCLGKTVISLLPNNAVYFMTDDFGKQYDNFRIYEQILKQNNKEILSSRESINDTEYKNYWTNPEKYFRVSEAEIHPSRLAHKLYSSMIIPFINREYEKWIKLNEKK